MVFSCFSCADKALLFRNGVSAEYMANNVSLSCLTRRRTLPVVKVLEASVDVVKGETLFRARPVKFPHKGGLAQPSAELQKC